MKEITILSQRNHTMQKVLSLVIPVLLFLFTTAFAPSKLSPLDGTWSGEFTGNAGVVPFETHFWSENDEIKGLIDFPDENVYGLELSWIIVESPSIHFEVTKKSGTLVFEGKLIKNRLIGEFKTKAERGTFDLSRN
jgi:hypothetical protein